MNRRELLKFFGLVPFVGVPWNAEPIVLTPAKPSNGSYVYERWKEEVLADRWESNPDNIVASGRITIKWESYGVMSTENL